MSAKRPDRTARRVAERAARKLVRDRERLASLERGGAAEHPIAIVSAAVVETRVAAMPCPQCGGAFQLREHAAPGPGLRRADVVCRQCHAPRSLWFRLVPDEPS